jgi:hypothetical protein
MRRSAGAGQVGRCRRGRRRAARGGRGPVREWWRCAGPSARSTRRSTTSTYGPVRRGREVQSAGPGATDCRTTSCVLSTTWSSPVIGPGVRAGGVEFGGEGHAEGAQGVLRLLDVRTAGHPPQPKDLAALKRASAAAPRAEHLGPGWEAATNFTSTGSDRPRGLVQFMAGLAAATPHLLSTRQDPSSNAAPMTASCCICALTRESVGTPSAAGTGSVRPAAARGIPRRANLSDRPLDVRCLAVNA